MFEGFSFFLSSNQTCRGRLLCRDTANRFQQHDRKPPTRYATKSWDPNKAPRIVTASSISRLIQQLKYCTQIVLSSQHYTFFLNVKLPFCSHHLMGFLFWPTWSKVVTDCQTQKCVSTDTGTFLKQQAIISLIHYMCHIKRPCLEITGLTPLRTAWLNSSKDSDQSLNSLILLLEGNKRYSRRNSIVKILSSVLFKGKSSTIKIPGCLSQDESSVVCTQKIWVINWTN